MRCRVESRYVPVYLTQTDRPCPLTRDGANAARAALRPPPLPLRPRTLPAALSRWPICPPCASPIPLPPRLCPRAGADWPFGPAGTVGGAPLPLRFPQPLPPPPPCGLRAVLERVRCAGCRTRGSACSGGGEDSSDAERAAGRWLGGGEVSWPKRDVSNECEDEEVGEAPVLLTS